LWSPRKAGGRLAGIAMDEQYQDLPTEIMEFAEIDDEWDHVINQSPELDAEILVKAKEYLARLGCINWSPPTWILEMILD